MTPVGESKSVAIANAAAAYASGDLVGQPMPVDVSNLTGGGQSVLIQSLSIIDASKCNKILKLVIFSALPGTVIADNAAFEPNLADIKNIADIITISTWDAYTAANRAVAKQQALEVPGNENRKFYVAVVAGEAITFGAANAITVKASYYID